MIFSLICSSFLRPSVASSAIVSLRTSLRILWAISPTVRSVWLSWRAISSAVPAKMRVNICMLFSSYQLEEKSIMAWRPSEPSRISISRIVCEAI